MRHTILKIKTQNNFLIHSYEILSHLSQNPEPVVPIEFELNGRIEAKQVVYLLVSSWLCVMLSRK